MKTNFIDYKLVSLLFFLLIIISFTFAISSEGNIHIFAVTENEKGMAAELYAYILPGTGEIAFFTSNSLVGKDTQTTGNIALDISQEKTNVKLGQRNLIYDIRANASEVDGPSAGAAMTLLVYSLLSERPLNSAVGITGTINTDGSIGAVGGVGPKAQIASEIGIKLFMIPTGQAITYILDEKGKNKSVNLLEYGPNELGLKIVEVSTIDEALDYAYQDIDEIKIDDTKTTTTFIPDSINYKPVLIPMGKISQEFIDEAKEGIKRAEKELELTDLDEGIRLSFYAQLGEAKRSVELSQIYFDQNYLYSAANYSFNAQVVAGTIETIASSPSLLLSDSKILDLKIKDLRGEIDFLKDEMKFIPLDKFEWLIGSQQRIAYAENALSNLDTNTVDLSDDEKMLVQIGKIKEYVSAEQWLIVAIDFFNEAKKSEQLRKINYSEEIKINANAKIESIGKILNDANITDATKQESQRRLNSAKISLDNGFYYAALYDAVFAQSFLNSEIKRLSLDPQDLEKEVLEMERKSDYESLWSNIFSDHATFFIENSKFEDELGRANVKQVMLSTSHDLLTLSEKIEDLYKQINHDLIKSKLEIFEDGKTVVNNETDIGIGITYTKNNTIELYLSILAVLLLVLLVILIIVGFKSSRTRSIQNFSRADKIDTLLNRLDKALSQKKISEAEYFFLKKKYEDEYTVVSDARAKRSKITLNLDESKAKLSALNKGLKDLKKHYKKGLIIPEDYERHLKEVNEEIIEVKEIIKKYQLDLHKNRLNRRTQNQISINPIHSKKAKDLNSEIMGTEELAKIEEKEANEEAKERKEILRKFKKK